MPIGHNEVDLGGSSCTQVLQQAEPALFVFLGTGTEGHHLFVALQIHCQGCQNDGSIGLVSMTNAEMHPIQVEHPPMGLQRTLSPHLKLLGQALVEPTDRAGTRSDSQQRLSHFPHLVRARASHEHLR